MKISAQLALVIAIGWALACRSGVGLALADVALIPLIARIQAEEALLKAHFGGEDEADVARGFIPVGLRSSPQHSSVTPSRHGLRPLRSPTGINPLTTR